MPRGSRPCPSGCACGKHTVQMPKCRPGCTCRRHDARAWVGENNPNWSGNAVQQRGVHRRLRIERGLARDYACVDCGGGADDWSFDESSGFSTDLTRYSPRCRSCHKRYDRAVA